MKKIILTLTILFFLTSLAQARQDPLLLEECVLSYNDPTFQAWNGTSGIVERVINHNMNFGMNESANYTWEFYQGERSYFNELGADGTTSKIPILEAKLGEDTFAYTKCTFKVGDRFVPYITFGLYPFYTKLTDDFNITTGILDDTLRTKTTWKGSTFSYQNPYIALEGVHEDSTLSSHTGNGLFPNTEFHKVYKHNLNNYPSSIVYLNPDFYGEGNSRPISPAFEFYFYINNTNINNDEIAQYLCPSIIGDSGTNIDTSQSYPPYFLFLPGQRIKTCITINNTFKKDLKNIRTRARAHTNSFAMGQVGIAGTNVSLFYPTQIINITNISQGETKEICNIFLFPTTNAGKPVVVPRLQDFWDMYNEKNMHCSYHWPVYGSDNITYLGIMDVTTSIEYDPSTKKPIFDTEMALKVSTGRGSTPEIIQVKPNDYSILTRIYENNIAPENIALEKETILDDSKFSQMGKTTLPRGSYNLFNLKVPIDASMNKIDTKYVVKFYTKKLLEPLRNFVIAGIIGTPYFKPGDIVFQNDNNLYFGSNSRTDSETITVFNPTLSWNNISLTVNKWSDQSNFLIHWKDENFATNQTKTLSMYPLETREITFWVNATYNPWISSAETETLEIKAYSDLRIGNRTEHKEQPLNFNLNLNPGALDWINLKPTQIYPTTININTINSTINKRITIGWQVGGSDSEISSNIGKTYKVKIILTNETGGILEEKTQEFTINERGYKEIEINHDFNYGEYKAIIQLDTLNNIAESDSSGTPAESDNNNSYEIRMIITDCERNATNYMFRYDFNGNKILDTEGICNCRPWEIMIRGEGYCADPNSGLCGTFSPGSTCNDWTQTRPGLCGWNSTNYLSTNPETCLDCVRIYNTCGGYNNEPTCDIDPCEKAEYDCSNLLCDRSKTYQCKWDANECTFQGNVNNIDCNYSIGITDNCNESGELTFNYTSVIPGCDNKIKTIACGQPVTTLNFFSTINLIITALLLTLFYATKQIKIKNKLSKESKNKNKK